MASRDAKVCRTFDVDAISVWPQLCRRAPPTGMSDPRAAAEDWISRNPFDRRAAAARA